MSKYHATRNHRARRAYLDASDRICRLCHQPGADTIDDVTPLSLGGTDTPDNWQPAHRQCNSRKANTQPSNATPDRAGLLT